MCSAVLYIRRPFADLRGSLSEQLSPLSYSVLCSVAAFVSLHFQLYLLNSGSPPGATSTPLPCAAAQKPSQVSKLWQSFICFPSVRDHSFVLPDVQSLKNHSFSYFVLLVDLIIYFFVCLRWEGRSGPFYNIFAKSRSPVYPRKLLRVSLQNQWSFHLRGHVHT